MNPIEKKLRAAATAYYYGEPILTDAEFDELKDQLSKISPKNPFLHEVGAPVTGEKGTHSIPMGSLRKAADWAELDSFLKGAGEFLVMPKYDGLSVSLTYEEGKLVRAITRGDGRTGEIITANVLRMRNVKKQLPLKADITLRGEILMDKDIFVKKYANTYANPRNTAVGIARRHDSASSSDLFVKYFAAKTIVMLDSRSDLFSWMEESLQIDMGAWEVCSNIGAIKKYVEHEAIMRPDYRWEMDGVVVSVNKFSERKVGDPLWPSDQIAVKFSADTSRTKVVDIIWEAGRTGRVNPTILVQPVQVNGVTIQRATGNNYGWMLEKKIGIDADVLISRRGDVIPAVEEVITEGQVLVAPEKCPVCNYPLVTEGAYLMCDSTLCPEKGLGLMKHWVELADIKGLGEAYLEILISAEEDKPHNLYSISSDRLQRLLGANGIKIYKEIHDKNVLPLENIFAAFIPNVGTRRFQQIIRAGYDTPNRLFCLGVDDLLAIHGFDEIMANRILEGIKIHKEDIQQVLSYVEVKKVVKKVGNKLGGFGIKFTGKMDHDRNTMEGMAQEAGAKIGWNSSLVNVLVIADLNSTSSKAKIARDKGYELWTPEQFLNTIK